MSEAEASGARVIKCLLIKVYKQPTNRTEYQKDTKRKNKYYTLTLQINKVLGEIKINPTLNFTSVC